MIENAYKKVNHAQSQRKAVHLQLTERVGEQAGGKPFKVTTPSNDHLLITSPELIRELIDAPLNRLSLHAVAKEILQPRYTMHGFEWQDQRGVEGTGFVRALRSLLTAHLPALQSDFERILQAAFNTELGNPGDDGFSRVRIFPTIKRTVTNVNCFVFFGEEMCKNTRFVEAALEFPQAVIFAAEFLRITPEFMRPAARTIFQYLEPVVRKRLQLRDAVDQAGSPAPVDCVQWLIDTSPRKKHWSPARMVGEIMAVWFGSVHQLAMTVTYAIEDLCIHNDCIDPLRVEIAGARTACEELGDKLLDVEARLPLLDSFLRESIRCTNSDAVTGRRKALAPYTFRDGTSTLAVGDWVCVPQRAMMNDASRYHSPHVFDAFRFARAKQHLEKGGTPSSLTTTSLDWPIWGFGNTACLVGDWRTKRRKMASEPQDLCKIPAAPSPNGVYNLDNPVTLEPNLISASVITTTVATVFLAGRLRYNIHNLGWSDGKPNRPQIPREDTVVATLC
ncbi:hypothetical protein O1611_g8849 [Lasiodiplodia mahajangana]|uniref:Uncharacterized protein n=1 Tax=Lasiodiplodia mahajangana TaxID=1108764 RepID=A0ACC2JBC0_9PEZI|nr:hypothetical protein O1611_g8849 [Lasiodiplodia mahajangana]